MSAAARHEAIRRLTNSPRPEPPQRTSTTSITDKFGSLAFNDAVQRRRLPRDVYRALRRTIDAGAELTEGIADSVANAMKDWAVEHGASHFTHWFQPMTGLTAEKHDAFLSPIVEGGAIQTFTGKELIKGEPDASSFPSGGIRATFEARGYTAWDPTSPAFLRRTDFGSTLCIPTAFCAWTGEALDTKTPLLRSCEALDIQARRILALIDEGDVKRVRATVGPEQEYFLIDRELYRLRPDLISCQRTLFGARPAKGQELEDHYFAATPERVLNFMMDLESQLWEVGVPVKTRHNEVAPHQFEMAPLYEPVSIAIDHNMLTMEMLQSVAEHHGFYCTLHEKPFAGVNGSGKHNNWSLADNHGNNLLDPGTTPHDNLRFILFLTALISAVHEHQDLLRSTYASAGNDHRLGGSEAPPAILSIFLGAELQEIVDALIDGTPVRSHERIHLQLGVTTLPPLPHDTSDRNRTSPFAFTGNKFELRATGSEQSIAFPNVVINTIVAEALDHMATEIENRARGKDPKDVIQEVVREFLSAHKDILFSGDNYSAEWEAEAERRGLLNLRNTPDALARLASEQNIRLFEHYSVLTPRETEAWSSVLHLAYVHRIGVETLCALDMARTLILPAALRFQKNLSESISAARAALPQVDLAAQESLLGGVIADINGLHGAIQTLHEAHSLVEKEGGTPEHLSRVCRDQVLPAMVLVRNHADSLESQVDNALWPLPKYGELLFIH